MKKRFYDFTVANAIVVSLAYISIFTISLYDLFKDDFMSTGGIIFNVLLFMSFVLLIIFYVIFPVRYINGEVKRFNKKIPKETLSWFIRPNFRLRYDEIIFRDKRIPYHKLSYKDKKKNEIRVQYFPKYESFLEKNIGLADEELEK